MKMKNLILIGYRGTGKTTIGKLLAKRLNWQFVDTDDLIVEKAQKSIPEIFKEYGEAYFRKLEEEVIENISKMSNYVIATGGGAVLSSKNISNLKNNGFVILLTSDVNTIFNRINNDSNRPRLKSNISDLKEEISTVLKERHNKYQEAKDFEIDTSNISISETINIILTEVNKIQNY